MILKIWKKVYKSTKITREQLKEISIIKLAPNFNNDLYNEFEAFVSVMIDLKIKNQEKTLFEIISDNDLNDGAVAALSKIKDNPSGGEILKKFIMLALLQNDDLDSFISISKIMKPFYNDFRNQINNI